MLLDGSRSQAAIAKESGLDGGDLSRLVKALAGAGVVSTAEKFPRILVKLPSTFFDGDEDEP
jgi:hypothetical protein